MNMTEKEKAISYETLLHIRTVQSLLMGMVRELTFRCEQHDLSKLEEPELSTFVEYTPKLKNSTYGSNKYKQFLAEMKLALDHHYSKNRHHPEHFYPMVAHANAINEIDCMNLIDVLEMFCDWKAATLRHDNGDIEKSIEINKKRFSISDQLVSILKNTVELFD
jgi:hypothetical protein